jgi:uncharacterized membrane protein YhhN
MPVLSWYVVARLTSAGIRIPVSYGGALLFSWAGDIALMIPSAGNAGFMAGIASFLVAQVFYIFLYFGAMEPATPSRRRRGILIAQLPVAAYATALYAVLFPGLRAYKIPVAIYTLALTGMMAASLFRYGRSGRISFIMVCAGAGFFMASDSMIAIDRFLHPIPAERLWVMSTYIVAQYLISQGLLEHFCPKSASPSF